MLLAATVASAATAQGVNRFDGQYVGELTLTGIVGGDCTRPPVGAMYPLKVRGGQVEFKYVPRFDTTLTGTVDRDGNIKAGRRLRHGFVTMTGRIEGRKLTAYIASPSCNYTFKTPN
jgi:hypothetical protein